MRYVMILSVLLSACSTMRPAEAPSSEPAEPVQCQSIAFLRPYTALRLKSADAWQAAYRGLAAYQTADYSRAATGWRSAAAVEPTPGLWFNVGLALARLGNFEHARKMLAKIDSANVPKKLAADLQALRHLLEPDKEADTSEEDAPDG